ncbi:MAG: protein kinase [Actinomycetota bacterium]|nr:protein kinase [Actinomycetota bacterium]
MSLNAGVRLGDRYELISRIAMGGMGEVWRGRDTTLQRVVAVKVLRSEYTGDPTFIARFRTEARNTAMLSHVNIAQVYDYGEAMAEGEHVAYLVMELVDGNPLAQVLNNGTRLAPPRVLDILGQTAAGLGVAHLAGVVHRDVKPANLIIRPDRVVKITDFGISRATDHVPLTGTGMVIGTAQYLSPEQAIGRPVTPASDVYALGVVGYEALAGRRPFDGESSVSVALAHVNRQPAPLPADVPGPIRDLIQRAMAKDPRQRFSDGAAFVGAIHSAAEGQSAGTRPSRAAASAAVDAADRTLVMRPSALPDAGVQPTARMPAVRPTRAQPPSRPVSYAAPPRQPTKARTGQWVAVVVLMALLIAGGLLAVWITQNQDGTQAAGPQDSGAVSTEADPGTGQGGEPPAEEPAPEPEPEPELVLVDTASFVGQPFADVEAALLGLDLVVNREDVEVTADRLETAGVEDQPFDKNDVITTFPAQAEVPPGSTVTVFVANKKYEPGDGNGNGNGDD